MIQVMNRAFDIIEYIASDPETPKMLSDIAKRTGLNAATCANIIKTLVDRRYVEKLDKKRGYLLGFMAYSLSKNYNYSGFIVSAAKQEIELLTKEINENSLCAILKNGKRVSVVKANCTHELQANTAFEKHPYDSASGRLLIAMLPDEELQNFIQLFGQSGQKFWEGSENMDLFRMEIERIRQEKYAIQITDKQIVGIAIPIYNSQKVIASLAVYLPATRFSKERKSELLRKMHLTAQKIEKNFPYS